MNEDTTQLDDAAFSERVVGRIDAAMRAAREDVLREALTLEPAPRRRWRTWAVALAAAAVGALSTWVATRQSDEPLAAFDGGIALERHGDVEVSRDARGRLLEIKTSGPGEHEERLIFRSGRVIRTEQWRAGRLHGVAVDYDAAGNVAAIRAWFEGVERGPWFVFDAYGALEHSGVRE